MLLEGYLNKEEAGSSTRSVRWFQIDLVQHRLYYYKNKDKEELLGLLSLSDVVDIEPKSELNFVIKTNGDEQLNLFAFSTDEMKQWVDGLNKAINNQTKSESSSKDGDETGLFTKDKNTASYEDLAIFDFEDFSRPSLTDVDISNEEENEEIAELGAKLDKKRTTPIMMGSSVPISIPEFSKTWQSESNWTFSSDEEEEKVQFEKPHELAAKTYKEQFLIHGMELDVPRV